jgi:hypothetical protein
MPAARAARLIMLVADPRGYEVIVPRRVEAGEIKAVRAVNRVVGWRYSLESKGRKSSVCP